MSELFAFLFLLFLTIPLTMASAPFVIGCALLLRRIFPTGILSLPLYLAVGQAVIISMSMALYPSGIFDNPEDAFPPYYFVPGAFIYSMTNVTIVACLNDLLFAHLPYQLANSLLLVVIPGLVGIVLGGLQWYAFGSLWIRYGPALGKRISVGGNPIF